MKKSALVVFSVFLSTLLVAPSGIAAPKKIFCEWNNPYIRDNADGEPDACPELDFTNTMTIILDTDDLTAQGSTVEAQDWNCSAGLGKLERHPMTATATTISVALSGLTLFNIDRTDLSAGMNTDRGWQCRIEDISLDRKI